MFTYLSGPSVPHYSVSDSSACVPACVLKKENIREIWVAPRGPLGVNSDLAHLSQLLNAISEFKDGINVLLHKE